MIWMNVNDVCAASSWKGYGVWRRSTQRCRLRFDKKKEKKNGFFWQSIFSVTFYCLRRFWQCAISLRLAQRSPRFILERFYAGLKYIYRYEYSAQFSHTNRKSMSSKKILRTEYFNHVPLLLERRIFCLHHITLYLTFIIRLSLLPFPVLEELKA